jgi:hypothetical protein
LVDHVTNPLRAQFFFRLSEHVENHQVPRGHSSQQLTSAAAMLPKELTAGKKNGAWGCVKTRCGRVGKKLLGSAMHKYTHNEKELPSCRIVIRYSARASDILYKLVGILFI